MLVRVSALVSTMDLTANTLPSITVSVYIAFAAVCVCERQRMKQLSRQFVTLLIFINCPSTVSVVWRELCRGHFLVISLVSFLPSSTV